MDPPPLRLGTNAAVQVIPHFDGYDGAHVGIVLIKERWAVGMRRHLRRTGGVEAQVADEPWDPTAPETSSIRYPSDVCLRKPSTDVIVLGNAVAPIGQEVTSLDVSVTVGPVQKTVRVFGARAWFKQGLGVALTDPIPFREMPIRWERAWGGADYESDPERPLEEARNPNGVGLVRSVDDLVGQMGPNIEDPSDLIQSNRSRPRPAGFGPIGRHWAPRRHYAGTFDEEWMDERMPLLPLDFDWRFNHVVAPDQVSATPLKGGEPVVITGMNERGPLRFELPKKRFFVGVQTANELTETPPQLDTVLLEPNDRRVTLTWRATVRLPRSARDLRFVQVHEKRFVG